MTYPPPPQPTPHEQPGWQYPPTGQQNLPAPQGQLPPPAAWPGHQQQVPPYPPPAAHGQTTVTNTGLPGWMHALYAIGGVFTCGALWIVWAIHWWFAQSKSKAQTTGYR